MKDEEKNIERKYPLYDELLEYYLDNLEEIDCKYKTSEKDEYPLYEELVDYYLKR